MSTDASGNDPRLLAWIDVVDYYWHRADVDPDDRNRLRDDLLRDLASSLADGASVEDLIAIDPREFAADLAGADGSASKPLRPDPTMTPSALAKVLLVGAAAGFAAALVSVYPIGYWLIDHTARNDGQEGLIAYGLHVVAATMAVAAAVAAARWRFRFQIVSSRSLVTMGVLFALGGSVSIVPTMTFARATGYSGSLWAMGIELIIVIGCCVGGAWTASRRLVRTNSAAGVSTF